MSAALAEPLDPATTESTLTSASSAARAEASRANGRRSRGPSTPEGKAKSRRNGCKEGLTGAGVVLPPDAEKEVDRREAEFAHDLQPRTAVERDLVRQMALGAWRSSVLWLRIVQHDARMNATRFANWEQDEQIAAAELGARLDENPEVVVAQLQRSSAGCEWLLARWRLLESALTTAGEGRPDCTWTDNDLALALNLLGRPKELRHLDHWPSWLESLRDQAWSGSNEAVTELREIVARQIAALEKRSEEVWQEIEQPQLRDWHSGVFMDLGPEGTRLHRYEAAADRLFHSAWNKLERLRSEAGEPLIDRSARKPVLESGLAPRPVEIPKASAPPAPQPPTPRQPAAAAATQPGNRAVEVVDFWIAGPPRNGSEPGSPPEYKTNPAAGRPENGDRPARHRDLL